MLELGKNRGRFGGCGMGGWLDLRFVYFCLVRGTDIRNVRCSDHDMQIAVWIDFVCSAYHVVLEIETWCY